LRYKIATTAYYKGFDALRNRNTATMGYFLKAGQEAVRLCLKVNYGQLRRANTVQVSAEPNLFELCRVKPVFLQKKSPAPKNPHHSYLMACTVFFGSSAQSTQNAMLSYITMAL